MTTIDDRIVSMKFDNSEFGAKISETIDQLDRLSEKISTVGDGKDFSSLTDMSNRVDLSHMSSGLDSIGGKIKGVTDESNGVDLSHMSSAVDNISSKFSTMGAIGFSAIQGITNQALGFVANFAKTDILDPIFSGGKQRSQTIAQAQFQLQGLGDNVTSIMASAKTAVQGTAYGLDDAAKAAATLGGAGVQSGQQMTTSLQAIAGIASITGNSYGDMAAIMTKAAAEGTINNKTLQEFAVRGLNATAAYAKATGQTQEAVHEMAKNGTLDYQQFAQVMDETFGAHATQSSETYSGALENMHAALSRLGETFYNPDLEQQRDLFNAMTPVIDNVNTALQPLIQTFASMKGFGVSSLIDDLKKLTLIPTTFAIVNFSNVIKNVFAFFVEVSTVVKEAFQNIFPAESMPLIYRLSETFLELSDHLKMGAESAGKVRDIFQGLFSIVAIGWGVIKGLLLVISDIASSLKPAGGGLLDAGAGLGSLLTKAEDFLIVGGKLNDFFVAVAGYITNAIKYLDALEDKIIHFFRSDPGTDILSAGLDRVHNRFNQLNDDVDKVSGGWSKMMDILTPILHALDVAWNAIANWFKTLGSRIAAVMSPSDFNGAVDIVNVGFLGGITVMLKKFLNGGALDTLFKGETLEKVKDMFSQVTNTLKSMQAEVKAETIMKIAEALGIMALSIIALSFINSADLTKSLGATAVGLAQLSGVMIGMNQAIGSIGGASKIALIAAAMIEMSVALVIFAGAVAIMGSLSTDTVERGLIGIGVGLGLLAGAMKLMPDSVKMFAVGLGVASIAFGLVILSDAVKAFGNMSWTEMAKGMLGVAVGLGAIVGAMRLMPKDGVGTGVAFITIGIGLDILSKSVKSLGGLNMGTLAKGLLGVVILLAAVAAAMNFMPADIPITAAGILILSVALGVMAEVVKKLGSLSLETLAKGLGSLAVVLGILVLAVNLMDGSIVGATAMVIVAGALVILAEVLKQLGQLSIVEIAVGLAAIAGTFLIIGLAAYLLEPVVPAMLGLGITLGLVGAGFALFGASAFLLATALSIFASVAVAAAIAFVEGLNIIGKAVPQLAATLALFVVRFLEDFLQGMPTLLKLLGVVLDQILDTIIKVVPKLAQAIGTILTATFKLIRQQGPAIIDTGLFILLQLLQGIDNNTTKITDKGIDIIVQLCDALADNQKKLVDAATNLILAFLNEIAKHIQQIESAGFNILVQFLLGIANNITKVGDAATSILTSFINAVGNGTTKVIQAGATMLINFLNGLSSDVTQIGTAVTNLITNITTAIGNDVPKVVTAGIQMIISLMNGIATAITTNAKALGTAMGNLANALVDGFWTALSTALRVIVDKHLNGITKVIIDPILDGLGIKSPSKVFHWIGEMMMAGWTNGIVENFKGPTGAMDSAGSAMSKSITKTVDTLSKAVNQNMNLSPVITPVVDLTKVQTASNSLDTYFGGPVLTPSASLQQASLLSSSANTKPSAQGPDTASKGDVNFTQTINAPTALSTNDIYRATKSQIVLSKEKLGIS